MTSFGYHYRARLWLFATAIVFTSAIPILFPVSASSVAATDSRRPQQQQQQQPNKQQQKRQVSFAVREGLSAGATFGRVDQSSGRGVAVASGGKTVARFAMIPANGSDTRTTSNAKIQHLVLIPAGDLFSVDPTTGILSARRELDREAICPLPSSSMAVRQRQFAADNSSPCTVVFGVAVRSGGSSSSASSVVMVTVVIDDVNDNAPSFYADPAVTYVSREVSESIAVGESAFQLPVAHDADADRTTNGRIATYRVEPETSPFRVQTNEPEDDGSDENELKIVLTAPLDREITDQYNVTVVAIDDGVPPLSGTISVRVIVTDVNDNSPKFDLPSPGGYDVTLATDAPIGTSVVRTTAFDPDLGDNGLVRYRFAARTQARYGSVFSIDPVSGIISTSGHVSFNIPSSTVSLVVLAEDQGMNSVPSATTVNIRAAEINRHAPEITFADRVTVAEKLMIAENLPPGSFVGHIIVQDPDVGRAGEVDCTVGGADMLAIESAEDNFRLALIYGSEYKLITGRTFDREQRENYNITIQCRDFGRPALTSSISLTVVIADVDDNKPVFPVDEYQFTIVENNDRGQVIGSVTATDSDLVVSSLSPSTSSGIEYSLAEPDGDTAAWFSVDQISGNITARVTFDREFVARFEFDVLARSVTASPAGRGGIEVIQKTGATAKVRVRVTVLDVDDEPPRFARSWYRFDVAESVPVGSEVGRVEAIDEDMSPFNSFFYQLEPSSTSDTGEQLISDSGDDAYDDRSNDNEDSNGGSHFAIDPKTGSIFTRRAIDRESLSHYAIRIRAHSDVTPTPNSAPIGLASSTSGPTSDVTVVFIRVTDVNDNAPEVIYPTSGDNVVRIERHSDVRAGDVITTVSARDRDVGANARLTYSIIGGDIERWFQIGSSTGTLRWLRDFVTEVTTVRVGTVNGTAMHSISLRPSTSMDTCPWTLRILVQDSGTPIQLSTTVLLNVIVEDLSWCQTKSSQAAVDMDALSVSRRTGYNPDDSAVIDVDHGRRHHQSGLHGDSSDGVNRPLFAGLTDWHIFVLVVAFATCVVVVGGLLTAAVVVRRGCSCGPRRRRCYQSSTSAAISVVEPRHGFSDKDDDAAVELKLLTSAAVGASTSATGLGCAAMKVFGNATAVVGRGLDGEPVLVMIDPEQLGGAGHVIMAYRDQQQQQQQHYLSSRESSISRYCNPYNETTLSHILPRDRDSDSGCGGDLSPAL